MWGTQEPNRSGYSRIRSSLIRSCNIVIILLQVHLSRVKFSPYKVYYHITKRWGSGSGRIRWFLACRVRILPINKFKLKMVVYKIDLYAPYLKYNYIYFHFVLRLDPNTIFSSRAGSGDNFFWISSLIIPSLDRGRWSVGWTRGQSPRRVRRSGSRHPASRLGIWNSNK